MEQTGERADREEIRSRVARMAILSQSEVVSSMRSAKACSGSSGPKTRPPLPREGTNGRAFGAGAVHERNDMPRVSLPSIGPGMPVPSIPGRNRGAGRPIEEMAGRRPWETTLTGSRGATDGQYGYANGDGPTRRLLHRGPQNGASPAMV